MPLRIYHYLFGILLNEIKSRKENKNAPLPACWAMIFYHGKQYEYPYKLDLASGFDDPKGIMEKFWQNPVQLINVNKISDQTLLTHKLDGILALALKHSRDKETTDVILSIIKKLQEIDIQDPDELQFANQVVSYLFKQTNIANRKAMIENIQTLSSPLRGELMTAAEGFKEDGKNEKELQIVLNCLKEGAKVDFISRITGLSTKEINKIAAEHKLH